MGNDDLFYDLKDSLVKGELGSPQFLPHDVVEATIKVERVKAILCSTFYSRAISLPLNVTKYARKIFAILILIGEPIEMKNLWKQGLRDEHLPLSVTSNGMNRGKLVADNGKSFGPLKDGAKTALFVDTQWLVLAPVIKTTRQHFTLNTKVALPFIESDPAGHGAFSSVYKCEVHKAHQEGLRVKEGKVLVAVKEFTVKGNRKAFDQEKKNLEDLGDLEHNHMIRHYATYEVGDTYYVIFPWAESGNLKEHWQRSKEVTFNLHIWVLRQMFALAGALEALHGRSCRHGDLKPENILCFDDATAPRLVIGDVGVSRIHKENTFLRTAFTETKATTPSYEAPEAYLGNREKRPRRYDVWSLGCIFLEFTIWCLFDYNSVLAFEHARTSNNHSYFYEPKDGGIFGVHPIVMEAITLLLKDPRCEPGSPFEEIIVLLRDRVLQVDWEKRAKADEVVSKLETIVSKASSSETFLRISSTGSVPKPGLFRSQVVRTPGKQPVNPKDSVIGTLPFSSDRS